MMMGRKEAPALMDSILGAVGHTPLVELSRLTEACGVKGRILAKLEYLNPVGSKKDRIALQIVKDAREQGVLEDGQPVVELTSGNTGTGLAMVCRAMGHPFVAVMSRGNSVERARMMEALGAEVVLVDQLPESRPGEVSGGDLELVRVEAERLVEVRGAFWADQFNNRSNFRAHYLHTAPEIWEQAGGEVDAFVDFVGTGGSFGGCATAFRERSEKVRCYIVEPEGAAVLAGGRTDRPGHPIQGGGYSRSELEQIEGVRADGYLAVTGEQARRGAWRLGREEGIFAGFSSGANVTAAVELLRREMEGATVAILICDSGLKYMSTDLWDFPDSAH